MKRKCLKIVSSNTVLSCDMLKMYKIKSLKYSKNKHSAKCMRNNNNKVSKWSQKMYAKYTNVRNY